MPRAQRNCTLWTRLATGVGAAALIAAAGTATASDAVTGLKDGRLMITEFGGHPPFKRRVVEIDASNVTELARFEPVSEPTAAPLRPRFPGKQFPLRRGR